MTNEALTSSFSRARRLRVSTALPSTVATTARGYTNSGILRDSSAIPPGWRRGRGSRTFHGPRAPFPVRRRPLQAARGAAGAGPGGSQREEAKGAAFPRASRDPSQHQPGAAVLKHCTEVLRVAGACLSSRSRGFGRGQLQKPA